MSEQAIIFGGTFDPVHKGHLIIARALAEAVDAGRVLMMPTRSNPLKNQPQAKASDRLAMLKLAVCDDPLLDVSDIELFRQLPSYSIDTVEQLNQQGSIIGVGRLCLAVGVDMLADLPRWHRVEDLLSQIRLLIALRPPWSYDSAVEEVSKLQGKFSEEDWADFSPNIKIIQTPILDISSTDIRQRLAAGQDASDLLPSQVAEYIEKNGLYR